MIAFIYYQAPWLMFVAKPELSYRLNADFEDHAEHGYVADHPELEGETCSCSVADDYGCPESFADVLRQIGLDERHHRDKSLGELQRLAAEHASRPSSDAVDRYGRSHRISGRMVHAWPQIPFVPVTLAKRQHTSSLARGWALNVISQFASVSPSLTGRRQQRAARRPRTNADEHPASLSVCPVQHACNTTSTNGIPPTQTAELTRENAAERRPAPTGHAGAAASRA